MTARTLPEWIGKTPDTDPPPRVKLRVLRSQSDRCAGCKRPLRSGDAKTCDHIKALINGGENRENNLQILGTDCCRPAKDRADVALKSKAYKQAVKDAGFRKPKGRPMPGSRASGIRKRMDGRVERW